MDLKVHGTILSPWVRRLMVFLDEKQLAYELVPVNPLGAPDPDFLKISPLGKVPVLEVDGRFLPDSLAACTFLEMHVASPPLMPTKAWEFGWMIWLCDFLATGVFSKVEAPLFIQNFINPNFRNTPPETDIVTEAMAAMPTYFDYLEHQLAGQSYLVGDALSLADLTAASVFINFLHAGVPVDAARWPQLAGYIDRLLARPSFQRRLDDERQMIGAKSPLFAETR